MRSDITGQVFHRLTAIRYLYTNKHRAAVWEFRCSCPSETIIQKAAIAVKSGHTKSCGCFYEETRQSSATTHGGCYEPEYTSYTCMMKRCYDKSHESYHRYGGRGVTVQANWHDNYAQFKKDMPTMPSPNHNTVDRIDGTRNYEVGNVRWATRKDQQRNMKSNVLLTFNGKTQCMAAWSEEKGWHPSKIKNRRRAGWSDEEILGTP